MTAFNSVLEILGSEVTMCVWVGLVEGGKFHERVCFALHRYGLVSYGSKDQLKASNYFKSLLLVRKGIFYLGTFSTCFPWMVLQSILVFDGRGREGGREGGLTIGSCWQSDVTFDRKPAGTRLHATPTHPPNPPTQGPRLTYLHMYPPRFRKISFPWPIGLGSASLLLTFWSANFSKPRRKREGGGLFYVTTSIRFKPNVFSSTKTEAWTEYIQAERQKGGFQKSLK